MYVNVQEMDSALVKLYAELDGDQLIALLASYSSVSSVAPQRTLNVDVADCIDWLIQFGRHYAIGQLHCLSGDCEKALSVWTRYVLFSLFINGIF